MNALRRLFLASIIILTGMSVTMATSHTNTEGVRLTNIGQLIRKGEIVVDGPTHNGKELQCDLPIRMHLVNKGGSDGAGLCVFTSINMAAEWQNVDAGRGLEEWMTHHPGGGYPEKVDSVLAHYCAERGIKVPGYVQHTGGDVAFLKLALASGRMPCVTYSGHDGVYYFGHIAHMVDLVYLDDTDAAILDNNFPGKYLWMSTDAFIKRWQEGGGWSFVWLGPVPPPLPANMKELSRQLDNILGCPACPNGLPKPPEATDPVDGYQWVHYTNFYLLELYKDGHFMGAYHLRYGMFRSYDEVMDEWTPAEPPIPVPDKFRVKEPVDQLGATELKSAFTARVSFGVDSDKLRKSKKTYSKNGTPCSWDDIKVSIGTDLPKTYLTFSGDSESRKSFELIVSQLPQDVLNTLSVQDYDPTNWAVSDVGIPLGLVCQGPVDERGRGAVQWRSNRVPSKDELIEVLRVKNQDYDPSKDPTLDERLRKKPDPVVPDPNRGPLIHPLPDNKDVKVAIPTWVMYMIGGFTLASLILRAKKNA